MQEDDSVPWYCLPCQILNWAEIFPFGLLTKSELLELYGVDLPSQLTSLPQLETYSGLENLPHLNDFDLDENLVHTINSKYHKISELSRCLPIIPFLYFMSTSEAYLNILMNYNP